MKRDLLIKLNTLKGIERNITVEGNSMVSCCSVDSNRLQIVFHNENQLNNIIYCLNEFNSQNRELFGEVRFSVDEKQYSIIIDVISILGHEWVDKMISIPAWQLKDVENALRLTSNMHQCPNRVTCFDRDVMAAWNIVINALNGDTSLPNYRLTYRQIPQLKED